MTDEELVCPWCGHGAPPRKPKSREKDPLLRHCMSTRAANILYAKGIRRVSDLRRLDFDDLRYTMGWGPTAQLELDRVLDEHDVTIDG